MLTSTGKGASVVAPTKRVRLSACMIVKDEERNLPRALKSLEGFVDELIVVDTGSTDRTVEIAESFGAKVYHHPWEGDFSKHRNQSLDYATGDWLFVFDADEELEFQGSSKDVRAQFDRLAGFHNAMAIRAKDVQKGRVVMEFHTTRLFRKGKVRYEGIVHNQPIVDGGAVLLSILCVRHYGYDITSEEKSRKAKRTVTLLKKRMAKDANDHACHFYLSQIYADMGDKLACVKEGEKYLESKNDLDGNFNTSIYYTVAHNLMKLGEKEKAGRWLFLGLRELPEDLDLSLCLVEYGNSVRKRELVENGVKKFISLYRRYKMDPMLKGNRFIYSDNPEAFCFCCSQLLKHQALDVSQTMHHLMKEMGSTDSHFRKKMSANLKEILDPLGMRLEIEKGGIQNDK